MDNTLPFSHHGLFYSKIGISQNQLIISDVNQFQSKNNEINTFDKLLNQLPDEGSVNPSSLSSESINLQTITPLTEPNIHNSKIPNFDLDKFDQYFVNNNFDNYKSLNFLDFPSPDRTTTPTAAEIASAKAIEKGQLLVDYRFINYKFFDPIVDYMKQHNIVRLAHRNKELKLSDFKDPIKTKAARQKLAKLFSKSKQKYENLKNGKITKPNKRKQIGRPLTPKTKVKLTMVPNLPTLYSMLVSDSANPDLNINPNSMIAGVDLNGKFHILKRGHLNEEMTKEELTYNSNIDWRFKSANHSKEGDLGGDFPGQSQLVTFLEEEDPLLTTNNDNNNNNKITPNSNFVGIDSDGSPIFNSVPQTVKNSFGIDEFTFLRVTRAAAFEKTGSIVLKMETVKPNDPWLNDDEFDLRLIYRMHMDPNAQNSSLLDLAYDDEYLNRENVISPGFIKKKVARPRYKANMRLYLVPRATNVILYVKESMLKRDIINGTLNLNDKNDPRLIITAFDFTNLLNELKIFR